jgi:hypothetical protein
VSTGLAIEYLGSLRRIAGREAIVARICQLAESTAGHSVRVHRIMVRAEWSHEYDERTGVVVDVEVTASNQCRFSYWEELINRLDEIAASLAPVDQSWLDREVSLTVIRA